jgi:transcriptional regulator with XRE-family HTH domain
MAAPDHHHRDEVRDFLTSRRERLNPEQAGIPLYGGRRRVKGLHREEVSMLAGMSTDYYTRLERGNLAGDSEEVLDSLCGALRLDKAERAHLFDLAKTAPDDVAELLMSIRRERSRALDTANSPSRLSS